MAEYNETKVKKGQAYNLAVLAAVHKGQASNAKYIQAMWVFYLKLGEILQGSDAELVKEAIDDPKFNKAIEDVLKSMER